MSLLSRFFRWLAALMQSDRMRPDPPPDDPPPASDEWEIAPGKFVAQETRIGSGWVEFEADIPAQYGTTDAGQLQCLWQMRPVPMPPKGRGQYASVKSYKIKSCYDGECREPRFPYRPGWRRYRVSWSQEGLVVAVDDVLVSTSWVRPWSGTVRWVIGDDPGAYLGRMYGAKVRGVRWG